MLKPPLLVPALVVVALIGTVMATLWYERFALSHGIIAKISSRTLHERTVPRGGGITFGVVFSLVMLVAWTSGAFSTRLMLAIGVGGAAAAAVGFFDDVYEIRALIKLGIQACLGAWLVAMIYEPFLGRLVGEMGPLWRVGIVLTVWFVPLWLMNLYNFIDGIDGLAIICSVFVCCAANIVLWLTNGNRDLVFVFALLGAASLGFLFLNLPPARVFMGDAGSIFLGYCFAALLIVTVATGDIRIWTWIAMLSYFIADTTTTTLCRMILVRNWYGVHRSHAYQNLARMTKSHARVTYGVALFNALWALPLTIWSALNPRWGPVAATLALAPAVVWTLRFGPRLSSD